MIPSLLLVVAFLLLSFPASAEEIGTLTMLQGRLQVIRGVSVLRGAEGMRVQEGDMFETSDPGFAQLELTEGTIVALGGSSRLLLLRRGDLILLSGWLKGENRATTGANRYNSPLLAATTREGTIVLHANPQVAEMFVESGSAGIAEVTEEGNLSRVFRGKAGEFFSRPKGANLKVSSHLKSTFVEAMPIPFRDTFPSRESVFAGKRVLPVREHEVSYSEIAPWLTIAPAWRKGFVERFKPRLKDTAFRQALAAHVNDYPEWDPVLHPEKYGAQAPPQAAGGPNRAQGRNVK